MFKWMNDDCKIPRLIYVIYAGKSEIVWRMLKKNVCHGDGAGDI